MRRVKFWAQVRGRDRPAQPPLTSLQMLSRILELFGSCSTVYAQIQQTAGCNATHTVESRLARCLLHTHDMSGDDELVLTQESMAQMIGARRNSVSLVANTLQQAKYIHYSRGHIEITDLDGLSKTSCECYATVKAHYNRLVRPRRLS
jgi:CRP-like cAMP-binding protein